MAYSAERSEKIPLKFVLYDVSYDLLKIIFGSLKTVNFFGTRYFLNNFNVTNNTVYLIQPAGVFFQIDRSDFWILTLQLPTCMSDLLMS